SRAPREPHKETEDFEPEEFVPPAAEQPVVRSPRMPQIEDLPQLAQNQLRAMREAQNGVPAPETRRRSLLEKLAAFGITRHDDEAAPAPAASPGAGDAASASPGFGAGRSWPRRAAPAIAEATRSA